MLGWLVCNEFLQMNKFNELHQWFVEAAKKRGVHLLIMTNAQVLVGCFESVLEQEKPDFVLFWDKDIRLAQALEQYGIRVFNSSKAIEICDDKSFTYLTLKKANLLMPKTILSPMTYDNIGYTNFDFLDIVCRELGFPLILKECFGSFGKQVYMIRNLEELQAKLIECGTKPVLFQEYVETSFARDIRIQVVGDQVVAAMYRYSQSDDFRANISNGGKMRDYQPTQEQKEVAIACCREIGLDFAGVDLLFGENETPLVCEVNSNAHFKNIFDCTSVNVADCIMEYIIEQIRMG